MEERTNVLDGMRSLLAAAVEPALLEDPWEAERARRISAASLILSVLWIAAALWVPAAYETTLDAPASLLTGMLIAAPIASVFAYVLSRSRYTVAAAAASAAIAGVATLVAASYQPALAVPLSLMFLFASVFVLGALFMPLQYAMAIAAIDLTAAMAAPRLVPSAGDVALQMPYLFLGLNAVLFAIVAPLRHRDERRASDAVAAQVATQAHAHTLRLDNQSKDELLRIASHELQSPLTVIYLQLQLLREHSRSAFTSQQDRTVQVLERNVRHLGSLLDDLMDKARLDAGRLPLALQPVDLANLVRQVGENFEAASRAADVRLDCQAPPIQVRADPVRIAQVLDNLVGNALKFTPRGGTVAVAAGLAGPNVRVTVTDSGRGLTPEQLGRLFQPFAQVHEQGPGAPKGSGLGLAISRGLVERHGGRLWAESAGAGTGTQFIFTLPVTGPTPSAATSAPRP